MAARGKPKPPSSGGRSTGGARSAAPRSTGTSRSDGRPGTASAAGGAGRPAGAKRRPPVAVAPEQEPGGPTAGGSTPHAALGAPARSPPPVSATKADRPLGGEQVEGRQAVRELLLAGTRKVREVWVATDLDDNEIVGDIVDIARSLRVPVQEVNRKRLEAAARSEAPQGVLAYAAPLRETELDDLLRRRPGTQPFLVAVDGVTDPGNLGALLRCCDGAGVQGVVIPRHRAVHVTPDGRQGRRRRGGARADGPRRWAARGAGPDEGRRHLGGRPRRRRRARPVRPRRPGQRGRSASCSAPRAAACRASCASAAT